MAITALILYVAIFFVSLIFSMLGQGGGTLYTPLQVWLGTGFHVAATTSLFLIMVTSLSATIVFRKAKRVDWPLALVLESVTTCGGFAGGFYSGRFSGAFLSLVFAGVVAFASFFMLRDFNLSRDCGEGRPGPLIWRRRLGEKSYCVNLGIALPVSFAAGVMSGLIGVGGGILKVPLMVLLLGIPMEIAVGCSAFMVGITALGGFFGHVLSGHWDWKTSLILAVIVFAGAQIGARKSIGIDKKKIKKGFGWFLLIIAAGMIFHSLR